VTVEKGKMIGKREDRGDLSKKESCESLRNGDKRRGEKCIRSKKRKGGREE